MGRLCGIESVAGVVLLWVCGAHWAAAAQEMPEMQMGATPMPGNALMRQMEPHDFLEEIEHHATSGTSAEPNATNSPMVMEMRGPWMLMLHGNGFVVEEQQEAKRTASGGVDRAGDKVFSTNWLMPMAEREWGPGQLTLRGMFSLEPATVTDRRYPLLFQQGETAFGKPIVDGQHPHDFFMELAALYDWRVGEKTLVSVYAAPVGDPAIGPTAYPHRASAAENPVAALGHHQEDSTHIAYDVVTAGVAHAFGRFGARVEASGFHGQEPDESRWTISALPVDSWSLRLTVQPGQDWSGQYSYARIASPEALFPSEDQARTTASVMYDRPFARGSWASTAVWGRTRSLQETRSLQGNDKEDSYLFESTLNVGANHAWTRLENAGRTNELLVGEHPLPAGFVEEPLAHVAAYTFGYDRDFKTLPHVNSALGAQVTTYGVPTVLRPIYGNEPVGVEVFLRLRVAGK